MAALVALSGVTASRAQDQNGAPATQAEAVQQAKRVRVSQGVSQKLLVTKVQPKYPEEARKQEIQGVVVLRVMISPEGDVHDATLVSGDLLLASAAKNAVRQWKYKPYFLDDMPVEVDTFIVVKFALPGN